MMMQRIRHANREAKPKQSLRQAERPEIAIAPKKYTRDDAPQQRGRSECEIWQVSRREKYGSNHHRGIFTANYIEQTVHNKILQEKLLVDGPKHIASNVREIGL
jgi:hypothetical protein